MDCNDGVQRAEIYKHRFDDGLGDRYYVSVYSGENDSSYVKLTQCSGFYSESETIYQTLEMTGEQWKNFEHCMKLIFGFLDALEHDSEFSYEAFHIVGRIYADAFVDADNEPMIYLYIGELSYNRDIVRKNNACISMDMSTLELLWDQFEAIDKECPVIAEEKPCFHKEDHSNVNGALQCPNCNPYGFMPGNKW